MTTIDFDRKRFVFSIDGAELVGVLRIPKGAGQRPAVVVDGPLTSVKEQAAGNYADALAARGFVTLAFDHRGFGESGGEPRQYEHPGRKVEDVRAAVGALSALDEVDPRRIGALGVCAGAGYMARAVADEPTIGVPTLMIHSEKALAPTLARKFYAALAGPKAELWVVSEGQIDFYDRPERIDPAADRLAEHFRSTL